MALYIKGKIKEGRGREGRKDRRDEEREEETALMMSFRTFVPTMLPPFYTREF